MEVEKYRNLSDYHFVPIGAKTYGAYGLQAIKLIKQIGKKFGQEIVVKKGLISIFEQCIKLVPKLECAIQIQILKGL